MINFKKNFGFGNVTLLNFINLSDKEKEMVRRWRNSRGIKKWMYRDHYISENEHSNFIKGLERNRSHYYWLIRDKIGKYIGVIYLNRMDLRNKSAYIGLYKSPDCKLSNIGNLLLGCLKRVSFDVFGLHYLRLEVLYKNKHAIAFYKKAGFNEEERSEKVILDNGRRHDIITMGIENKSEARI